MIVVLLCVLLQCELQPMVDALSPATLSVVSTNGSHMLSSATVGSLTFLADARCMLTPSSTSRNDDAAASMQGATGGVFGPASAPLPTLSAAFRDLSPVSGVNGFSALTEMRMVFSRMLRATDLILVIGVNTAVPFDVSLDMLVAGPVATVAVADLGPTPSPIVSEVVRYASNVVRSNSSASNPRAAAVSAVDLFASGGMSSQVVKISGATGLDLVFVGLLDTTATCFTTTTTMTATGRTPLPTTRSIVASPGTPSVESLQFVSTASEIGLTTDSSATASASTTEDSTATDSNTAIVGATASNDNSGLIGGIIGGLAALLCLVGAAAIIVARNRRAIANLSSGHSQQSRPSHDTYGRIDFPSPSSHYSEQAIVHTLNQNHYDALRPDEVGDSEHIAKP